MAETVKDLLCATFGLAANETVTDACNKQLDQLTRQTGHSEPQVKQLLLKDRAMREQLAGRLTTPETYFLRLPEDFEAVKAHFRARHEGALPSPLYNILSIGCSTGEEPYSTAMVLQEDFPAHALQNVTITACDISMDAIDTAQKGEYSKWSMRIIPEHLLLRHFRFDETSQRWTIGEDLKRRVRFRVASAQRVLNELPSGSVDVVFFRNVNIYLLDETTQAIYQKIHELLAPHGILIVSPTDVQPGPDRFTATATASNIYTRHCDKPERHSYHPPIPTKDQLPGKVIHPQNTHLSDGLLRLEQNRPDLAESSLRKALFENRRCITARFWYAVSLSKTNHPRRASAQLNALISQLVKMPADRLLTDWDITVAELLQVSRHMKEQLQ